MEDRRVALRVLGPVAMKQRRDARPGAPEPCVRVVQLTPVGEVGPVAPAGEDVEHHVVLVEHLEVGRADMLQHEVDAVLRARRACVATGEQRLRIRVVEERRRHPPQELHDRAHVPEGDPLARAHLRAAHHQGQRLVRLAPRGDQLSARHLLQPLVVPVDEVRPLRPGIDPRWSGLLPFGWLDALPRRDRSAPRL